MAEKKIDSRQKKRWRIKEAVAYDPIAAFSKKRTFFRQLSNKQGRSKKRGIGNSELATTNNELAVEVVGTNRTRGGRQL